MLFGTESAEVCESGTKCGLRSIIHNRLATREDKLSLVMVIWSRNMALAEFGFEPKFRVRVGNVSAVNSDFKAIFAPTP